ncbi:MAG TPA: alpha/beta fold hydrolase [Thermosynechococcaceae cyanobacterium]
MDFLVVRAIRLFKQSTKCQKSIIVTLVALLCLGIAFDQWLPYALISHYKRPVLAHPAILDQYGAQAEFFTFTTRDRLKISGWFIPAKTPTTQTLILLHSRGGTRQDTLEFGLPLWQAGSNVVMIDLRGHGTSEGKYFTFGYHEWQDVSGLLDYLESRADGTATEVTLLGISAGGAVAIAAAAQDHRIDRLITIATFADLDSTIRAQVPWLPEFWRVRAIAQAEQLGHFSVRETSPLSAIRRVRSPVLIVHPADDRYIPLENGKQLFAAASSPKAFYVIAGATHETMLRQESEALQTRILAFMSQ